MRTDQPESKFWRDLTPALLVVVVLSLVSIMLHRFWCGTPVASSEERWQEILEYHRTFYPFSIRYFTTRLVIGIHQFTSWPVREVFLTLQYLLMGSVALLFYRFLLGLRLNRRSSLLGLVLYLTAFPILFAHSEPVFTWDDGWTYLFLLLCVVGLKERQFYVAAVWFTTGCFAREQMILYLPVFAYGIGYFGKQLSVARKVVLMVLPLAIYGLFYLVVYQTPDPQRFALLQYNFSTGPQTNNTLFSLFIAFGAIWLAWVCGLFKAISNPVEARVGVDDKFIIVSSVLAVVPTVIIGLTLAYARETRIFFPPYVLVIPVALIWFEQVRNTLSSRQKLWIRLAVVMAIGLSVLAVRVWQPDLDFRNCPEFCHNWLGVQLGLSIGVVVMALVNRQKAEGFSYRKTTTW